MQSPTNPPPHPKAAALRRVRALSQLLDNSIPIPGTNQRIGLDPILGLLPAGGDVLGAALSLYIVVEAARLGLPQEVLVRMVSNLLLDAALGSFPVLGDLFDATWKANSKNAALIDQHVQTYPSQTRQKTNWGFIALLIAGFVFIVVGIATLSFFILRSLFHLISGS